MSTLKIFLVDQIYMLKAKSDEKQILSNNEKKALINNLIAQIKLLKNKLRSKETIIKLIIKNLEYNNEYFRNKNYCDNTRFFISNTFTSNVRLKLAKNQLKSKQHPEAELLLIKNYSPFSSTLPSKNNSRYSKKSTKS